MSDLLLTIKTEKFRYLIISQFLSQLAIQFLNFLFLIKISNETNSPFASSLLWIFYSLPALFIGPISAVTVDIFDRRKILIYSNLFQGSLIFLFSFLFDKTVFMFFAVTFIYSMLNQFYVPAEAAAMTTILPKKDYPNGNSLFFFSTQSALILGFLLAGPFNAIIGFRNSLNWASIMLFVAFLSVLKLPKLTAIRNEADIGSELNNFTNKIVEGYRFIKNNPKVKLFFFYMIFLQIMLTIVVINMPYISKEILIMSPELGGLFLVFPVIIGAVFASLLIPRKIKVVSKRNMVIKIMTYLLSLSLFSVGIIIPEIQNTIIKDILFILSCVGTGFSFIGIYITVQTYFQENTPNELRGRVFGNYWFVLTLTTFFPVVFSGILTEFFGIRSLIFILSIMVIMIFLS